MLSWETLEDLVDKHVGCVPPAPTCQPAFRGEPLSETGLQRSGMRRREHKYSRVEGLSGVQDKVGAENFGLELGPIR
jgi:hypothetical protein